MERAEARLAPDPFSGKRPAVRRLAVMRGSFVEPLFVAVREAA
jgi:hypothetical protein